MRKLSRDDKKLKESQRSSYNQRHRAREQNSLDSGALVWITDLDRQGTIVQEVAPRSYSVQTFNGIIRRNRRQLNVLPGSSGELEESDQLPDLPETTPEESGSEPIETTNSTITR
uniref:Uncharacterized protein n=1 Tax=Amphimedon queenslandica TaxID=400682 RepID=A0A1X7VWE0_AMPQE